MTDRNGRVTNFQDNSSNRNFFGIAIDDSFIYLTSQARIGFRESSLMRSQALMEVWQKLPSTTALQLSLPIQMKQGEKLAFETTSWLIQ